MDISIKLTMPSQVPHWLIALAERTHRDVLRPEANYLNGLMALLLTVTAAEAAINCMLEPLMSKEEWLGTGKKRNGFDFAPTAAKWERLSRELGLAQPLAEDVEPLAPFLKTITARHALVHYKHSRNINEHVLGPAKFSFGTSTMIPIGAFIEAGQGTQLGEAEAAMAPEAARAYYPSFEKLLRAVLPAYAAKDDSLVLLFKGALDGQVQI